MANEGWSWSSFIEKAQISAKDLAVKAQEIAEVAGKVAQEKAVVIAAKAQEMRQNYDVDTATSNFLSAVGAIPPSADKLRPSYTDGRPSTTTIRSGKLDLVYYTENVLGMAYPCDPLKPCSADSGNNIHNVAKYLKSSHEGHFMIWNISEESYDYSLFGDQVLEYKFPGHPAPPLGMLFKICTSIESWLDADEKNVAVIHCLTGKGRTAALAACVLTWIGEFASPKDALQYVADRRKLTVDNLTIPSQQRYVQYFANMLDGVRPRSEPLLLRRVIINSIPIYGDNGPEKDSAGCCPYIQIFKCGRLIATSVPAVADIANKDREHDAKLGLQLKWISVSEGSVSFNVDVAVQGDLLLRCRHADASGVRISMFRAAFHTGYVPSGVLRLTKAELDGSHTDSRYADDFFVDLIFAPIEKASPVSTFMPSSSSSASEGSVVAVAPSDSGITLDPITSDKYELTLHRDSRFWDAVASRKQKAKKRKPRKFSAAIQEQFSIGDDSSSGPLSPSVQAATRFTGAEDDFDPTAGAKSSNLAGDLDLIQQLANAELSFSTPGNSSLAVEATSELASGASTISAVGELMELDLLERELGLPSTPTAKGGGTPSTTTAAPPPAPSAGANAATTPTAAKTDDFDLDNLEDLENYLNSLSTK